MNALRNTAWRVLGAPGGVTATAEFGDGVVTGLGGCNRYRAPYEAEHGRFGLTGPASSTLMAGSDAEMQTEADLLAALGEARRYQADVDELHLLDEHGRVLLALRRLGAADLAGEWAVTSVHRPARHAVDSVEGPTITVSATEIVGHGGVNRFRGPFAADDRMVRIGPLVATRMAGPPTAMALEADLLAALEDATGWRLGRGDTVTLLRADGGVAVSLTRAQSSR